MTEPEPYFVIPTHRLRDVGVTIHEYDEHFWRNGHSVQMIVFDDSTQANVDKYLPVFEQTKTRSELFYVGPREKEEFIAYVNSRLRNKTTGAAGQKYLQAKLRWESQLFSYVFARRVHG